jgi:hypothetical protein
MNPDILFTTDHPTHAHATTVTMEKLPHYCLSTPPDTPLETLCGSALRVNPEKCAKIIWQGDAGGNF